MTSNECVSLACNCAWLMLCEYVRIMFCENVRVMLDYQNEILSHQNNELHYYSINIIRFSDFMQKLVTRYCSIIIIFQNVGGLHFSDYATNKSQWQIVQSKTFKSYQ